MENYKKALNYALTLLAKRNFAEAELTKKLKSKKIFTDEEIEKVIKKLLEVKYLDDSLFIESYIRSQLRNKPQGIKKVKYNLQKKGISKDLIAQKINQADIDETVLALEIVKKKKLSFKNLSNLQQKEKLYRFLLGRGFSAETIYKALKIE